MTEQTTPMAATLTGLRADNARLRAELRQVRRELENARAALAWIDSLQALDVLDELDDQVEGDGSGVGW